MGTVRFVLAMLVVYFHVQGARYFGVPLPDGRIAVQMFYVISGFYMALILNEKYRTADTNLVFYTNRFLRLWPPIFIVSILILTKFVLLDQVLLFGVQQDLGEFMAYLRSLDPLTLAYLAFTNLFVFGQDLLWFVRIEPGNGLSYAPFVLSEAHNGSSFSLNHVLFTVAIEASFYLVSPFIVRRSVLLAFALFVLGGIYHVLAWVGGLDRTIWSYHFFLSAAYFYFLGVCAYHLYVFVRDRDLTPARLRHVPMLEPGLYVAVLGVALLVWAYLPRPSMTMALLLAALIPLLFLRTRRSVVDRFVGELSFGIYLTHYPLYLLLGQYFGPRQTAVLTAMGAIGGAMLLYVLVERPLDRWRQARARAERAGHGTSGVTPDSLVRNLWLRALGAVPRK